MSVDQERLRMLGAAVERLNDMLIITEADPIDPPGPRIVYVNEAFERATGYRREEIIGRSPRVLQGPETDRSELARIRDHLAAGRSISTRLVNYSKSGRRYPVELTISPVLGADGRVTHFVAVERDLTERLAMEARQRQVQHLEAVAQLTGGVAHDFNNLLTVILGNADLLAEALDTDGTHRGLANAIVEAAQRGSELTHRLLAFAGRQALEPRAVDVDRLLTGMTDVLGRTLGSDIELRLDTADDTWHAHVDPAQLEAAILDMIVNAREAMPAGGRLTITTRNVRLDDADAARGPPARAGEYVELRIADTGAGITAEHRPRIFQPFFTTKARGSGTGLGLATVYGFVRQSGGHVEVRSEAGRGTAFSLFLPRSAAPADAPRAAQAPATPRGGCERVLLVEDDLALREYARYELEFLGYRVRAAGNAHEALHVLRGEEPFDLLFTDVIMPGGLNGAELAHEARALRPSLRVLFTSGYSHDALIDEGRLQAGVRLLRKPYRRADLAAKLRDALEAPAA